MSFTKHIRVSDASLLSLAHIPFPSHIFVSVSPFLNISLDLIIERKSLGGNDE